MRVAFIASDLGGAGHVRSIWPCEALKAIGWDCWWSNSWINAQFADVVVAHRPLDPHHLTAVHALIRDGKVVIVDEDDDLTGIPARFYRGTFDHDRYQPLIKGVHDVALREAHGAIFSTQAVADRYGPTQPNHAIVGNYLPSWISEIAFYQRRTALRVGWAGIVDTHEHDLLWLSPETPRMLGGAVFTCVGDMSTPVVLGVPGPCECLPYMSDLPSFYQQMARADIGIVPLDKDGIGQTLNMGKSSLKAMEYLMLGKPVVVVDLPEQRALLQQTGHGLVASTPSEFAECVQWIIRDADLREHLTLKARRNRGLFFMENNVHKWATAITTIVERSGRSVTGSPIPAAVASPAG